MPGKMGEDAEKTNRASLEDKLKKCGTEPEMSEYGIEPMCSSAHAHGGRLASRQMLTRPDAGRAVAEAQRDCKSPGRRSPQWRRRARNEGK